MARRMYEENQLGGSGGDSYFSPLFANNYDCTALIPKGYKPYAVIDPNGTYTKLTGTTSWDIDTSGNAVSLSSVDSEFDKLTWTYQGGRPDYGSSQNFSLICKK